MINVYSILKCPWGEKNHCPMFNIRGKKQPGKHNLAKKLFSAYFKNNFIYLFIFGAAWAVSYFHEQGLLSSCGMWASHCGGFSCCIEHGLSSCVSWA